MHEPVDNNYSPAAWRWWNIHGCDELKRKVGLIRRPFVKILTDDKSTFGWTNNQGYY